MINKRIKLSAINEVLSEGLLVNVFEYMDDIKQINKLKLVCKCWHKLCDQQTIWRQLYCKKYQQESLLIKMKTVNWKRLFLNKYYSNFLPATMSNLCMDIINSGVSIVDVYSNIIIALSTNGLLFFNLSDGSYIDCITNVFAHKEIRSKISKVSIDRKRAIVYICDDEGEMEVYDIKTRKLVAWLNPSCSIFFRKKLIIDMKVLNSNLVVLAKEIKNDTGVTIELWKLEADTKIGFCLEHRMYSSCSSYSPISIMSMKHEEARLLVNILFDVSCLNNEHAMVIQEFEFQNETVSSKTINTKFNASQPKSVPTCYSYNSLAPDLLVTGYADNTIYVWRIGEQIVHEQTLYGHTGRINCILVEAGQKNRIISGANDCSLKVWCLSSGKCLESLAGHNSPVLSLALCREIRLVSSDVEGVCKLWGFDV